MRGHPAGLPGRPGLEDACQRGRRRRLHRPDPGLRDVPGAAAQGTPGPESAQWRSVRGTRSLGLPMAADPGTAPASKPEDCTMSLRWKILWALGALTYLILVLAANYRIP